MKPFKDDVLVQLYLQYHDRYQIFSDSLVSQPKLMSQFAAEYTALTGHVVESHDVANRLIYIRKKGKLPKLKGK